VSELTDTAAGGPVLSIFDAHHHLWDLSGGGHYPWLQDEYDGTFFLGDYRALCKTFLPADLRARYSGYRLVGSVHVEAERSRLEQVAETVWLEGQNAATGLPSAIVGHVHFVQPDCAAVLAQHAASPLMRGIRSKPVISGGPGQSVAGQPGTMQDPHWLDGYALLAQHRLSWDLRVPYWHLSEAAEVARAFPTIPVVANHLGLPLDRSEAGLAIWRQGMAALADCSNVSLKVSELGLPNGRWDGHGNARLVREAIGLFGWDRVMFASNLPVSGLSADLATIIDTILQAVPDAGPDQIDRLFRRNAMTFYRIT
jgi:predicted TIM-barrel fold metal-dependent hydrolase